jgi:hypothetical protein
MALSVGLSDVGWRGMTYDVGGTVDDAFSSQNQKQLIFHFVLLKNTPHYASDMMHHQSQIRTPKSEHHNTNNLSS